MAWLVTIVRRLSINEIRRRQTAPTAMDDVADNIGLVPAEPSIDSGLASPKLLHCLGKLNEEPRQAVLLAYVHGFTHEELAARFDRPPGTVKSWIRRGLIDLKECLG
jgi:RNA polymerase sigma-70 factor (ECF subfamily)